MTVAVLSALQTELDLLLDSVGEPKSMSIAGWQVWTGHIEHTEIVLAKAGLGKVNTAALSALVWERHQPSLMIFTGVAGGLDPNLGVGDLVVADRTIQHDAGVITSDGLQRYQAGHLPFFNPTDEFGYTPSQGILEMVQDLLPSLRLTPVLDRQPRVVFGTILTGDVFLADVKARDRLFAEFSAHAIEMEGAALAQTSSRLGVDHVVIRSLSDLAGDSADQHFARFLPEVSANSARLVSALLHRLEEDQGDLPIRA
ncbi:MAG TPA: 5'-methylthioadenosine/adenosylhomocysteine nucleosidase [Acidimicrobiia bacterium]